MKRPAAANQSNNPGDVPSPATTPASSGDGEAASVPRARSGREVSAAEVLEQIQQALAGLKFGHVTITVQDGVVVQIERIEKRRLR